MCTCQVESTGRADSEDRRDRREDITAARRGWRRWEGRGSDFLRALPPSVMVTSSAESDRGEKEGVMKSLLQGNGERAADNGK